MRGSSTNNAASNFENKQRRIKNTAMHDQDLLLDKIAARQKG